jgi:hypothetical protein
MSEYICIHLHEVRKSSKLIGPAPLQNAIPFEYVVVGGTHHDLE